MERTAKQVKKRRIARIVSGWVFLVLGVAGLVLPVLQGILFIAIGITLLAPYVAFFRRIQMLVFKRFPALEKRVHAFHRARFQRAYAARKRRKMKDETSA